MSTVAIVGCEEAKFTPRTKAAAYSTIAWIFQETGATRVVSGDCPLGGVDKYAVEIARASGLEVIEHAPKVHRWGGPDGFMARNLLIANDGDVGYCLTLAQYPDSYPYERFDRCYHCGVNTHVKSGGCWTIKQMRKLGKPGEIIILTGNEDLL
jgi:hypothetical protein